MAGGDVGHLGRLGTVSSTMIDNHHTQIIVPTGHGNPLAKDRKTFVKNRSRSQEAVYTALHPFTLPPQ